jgi:hypothetical protein
MPYEHDVLISYPHISNRNDSTGQNGWVARFHTDLKSQLDELLGSETRVWRDNKMAFGTEFGRAISNRLKKTKVFLCVLSPAYVRSEWCRRELDEFRRHATENGGLVIQEQSRIVPVFKTPIEDNQLGVSESLYCRFYEDSEDRGGAPRYFSQDPGGFKHDEYKRRVGQLAWSICLIIKALPDDHSAELSRTIYLAETSSDRDKDRTTIKDELEARNFIVLPAEPLPNKTADDYVAAARANLESAFMSIHLLGSNYGLIPENAGGKSVVQLQNELASRRSADDGLFKRVIWIPKGLVDPEEKQAEFLQNLRTDENSLLGAEMVERSLEDLKTRIVQILVKTPPKRELDNLIRIYLMCDSQDDDSVEPVGRFLFEKGYEVILPPEEKGGRVLRYHKNSLLRCDAALTIYGNAKFEWVQDRYDDVVTKVKGWGRAERISCSAILPTAPETRRKSVMPFCFRLTRILPACYSGLSRESLEAPLNEFINELEQMVRG